MKILRSKENKKKWSKKNQRVNLKSLNLNHRKMFRKYKLEKLVISRISKVNK